MHSKKQALLFMIKAKLPVLRNLHNLFLLVVQAKIKAKIILLTMMMVMLLMMIKAKFQVKTRTRTMVMTKWFSKDLRRKPKLVSKQELIEHSASKITSSLMSLGT